MKNKTHQNETSTHRIDMLLKLSENFEAHSYLLPEILAKTIRDIHRFNNDNLAYYSSVEIMDLLNIDCSEEEKELLTRIENALRKMNDYTEISQSYSKELLLSITLKLQNYITKSQG